MAGEGDEVAVNGAGAQVGSAPVATGGQVNLVPKKKKGKRFLVITLSILGVAVVVTAVAVLLLNKKTDGIAEWSAEDQQIINGMVSETLSMSQDETKAYLDSEVDNYAGTGLEFETKITEINILANRGMTDDALAKTKEINIGDLSKWELMNYYSAMQSLYYNAGNDEQADYYQDLYMDTYFEIYGDEEDGG